MKYMLCSVSHTAPTLKAPIYSENKSLGENNRQRKLHAYKKSLYHTMMIMLNIIRFMHDELVTVHSETNELI